MTEIVPEGHKLLSEVCQAVIDADPAAKAQWEASNKLELECRAILQGPEAPADAHQLASRIEEAEAQREKLKLLADQKVREALRSGQLIPITTDGSQIKNHDWRDYFDSDYVFADGKRVLVLFTNENVSNFIARLFELKSFDDLGPRTQLVVGFLRKNFSDTNFGPVNALKRRLLDELPELNKSLDDKTLRAARQFFEAELKARSGSR
jgi:hypothetical protein